MVKKSIPNVLRGREVFPSKYTLFDEPDYRYLQQPRQNCTQLGMNLFPVVLNYQGQCGLKT